MGFWAKLVDDSVKEINPLHVVLILMSVAIIAWGCWEAYHTQHMPTNLSGAAELLTGVGAANLAHKAQDIVEKFQNKAPQFPTPPPMVMPPQ